MRQCVPALFLLLLLPLLSIAQKNYKEGFVVTTQGDTLRGFIDYKEWMLNPGIISFQTSANSGAVQTFTPSNSSYFEITGMEVYRSYEGAISMDRVDKDDLSYVRADTSVRTDQVFLKKHLDGPNAALYSYKDNIKQRFFILEKREDKPQELIYKRYFLATNNNKVVEQRYYVGQLLNVARHQGILTDKLQREIEAAAYKELDLLRVVSKLNGRNDEEITQDRQGRIGSRFFAGIALSRGTMEINGQDTFADADENATSYMPRLAFGIDAFLNRNVQQLVFRLEASLTNASYHMQKTEKVGVHGYNELSYEATQQTASLLPQIIYNLYNKDNFKLYAGGGFALNYSNYSKNTYRRQYINPNINVNRTAYENENHKELLSLWTSYALRAGVVVNRKYEISAMYVAPGTLTRHVYYEVATGSMSIGINYLFKI